MAHVECTRILCAGLRRLGNVVCHGSSSTSLMSAKWLLKGKDPSIVKFLVINLVFSFNTFASDCRAASESVVAL